MARLARSAQIIPHVLPDTSTRAAFGRHCYRELMRAASKQVLIEQALATQGRRGFMAVGRYMPHGMRTTLS